MQIDFNIFDEFQSVAVILFNEAQIAPFWANGSFFKLALEPLFSHHCNSL